MSPFDRLLKTMLQPWIAASYVGFTVLSFFYFDKPIAYFFNGFALLKTLPLLKLIAAIGINKIYIVGLFLLFMFFRYIRRDKEWEARLLFLWLCVLVSSLICFVLKVLLSRARPELLFDNQLYGFYGMQLNPKFWSFPSGHTTTITSLAFGLCIVFPRHCYAFLLTGLLILSTRIFLSKHYLSDVMLTSFLTLLEVRLLLSLLHRRAWLTSVYKPMLYAV